MACRTWTKQTLNQEEIWREKNSHTTVDRKTINWITKQRKQILLDWKHWIFVCFPRVQHCVDCYVASAQLKICIRPGVYVHRARFGSFSSLPQLKSHSLASCCVLCTRSVLLWCWYVACLFRLHPMFDSLYQNRFHTLV